MPESINSDVLIEPPPILNISPMKPASKPVKKQSRGSKFTLSTDYIFSLIRAIFLSTKSEENYCKTQ
ncbi:MAG: hypothetical protein DRN04_06105 [Thermoprotei archaeon]|nr:MAG: hypothetical protein DRN04_06105 [Thermoprotei archaeon]